MYVEKLESITIETAKLLGITFMTNGSGFVYRYKHTPAGLALECRLPDSGGPWAEIDSDYFDNALWRSYRFYEVRLRRSRHAERLKKRGIENNRP